MVLNKNIFIHNLLLLLKNDKNNCGVFLNYYETTGTLLIGVIHYMEIAFLRDCLLNTGFIKNNEYFNKYFNLLYDNRENKQGHVHHIIPKFYFKDNNIEVLDDSINTVVLSCENHILAHFYLYKCSFGVFSVKNGASVQFLTGNKNWEKDEKLLTEVIHEYARLHKDILDYAHKKAHESNKGRVLSDDIKNRISLSLKGHTVSESTRLKISESNKKTYASKEIETIAIKLCNEIDTFELKQYYEAHSVKDTVEHFGLHNKTNLRNILKLKGIKVRSKSESMKLSHATMSEEDKKSFSETMRKLSTNRKISDETRRKISESNKGRAVSDETRRKISDSLQGNIPWNKGIKTGKGLWKHTDESKRKISEARKGKQGNSNGTVWVNNGTTNKRVKNEMLSEFLNNGFKLGRK